MPKLVLIDGSSYLYRAFHALPPLSNAAGEPTGALFGVVNMLRATLAARPDYLAFVLDAPGPTFREAIDPQYKANRPPMPDDLRAQIEPMLAVVQALGIPTLRVAGVEADDVIGTLAQRAAQAGIEVEISTSDKDFAQLVGPRVTLINSMDRTQLDRAGVQDKFGVPPERIVDYLALMGDKVDNIRGVDKCGPKTATKWLAEYGDLDGVMAHADAVPGKLGENLRAARAWLPRSRDLATIRTALDLDTAPEQLALRARNDEALRALYQRYGFNSALAALQRGDEEPAPRPAVRAPTPAPAATEAALDPALAAPGRYTLIATAQDFDSWLEQLRDAALIAFDTETTSLDAIDAEIVGVSFAVQPGVAAYVPLAHDYPGAPAQLERARVLAALKPLLEDATRPKLLQNAKYDMEVLVNHGIALRGVTHDSMLESYVWNATATRHDMDSLAQRYLGYTTIKFEDVAGKGAKQIPFAQVDLDTATRYAAEDADITLRLHRALWPRLEAEPDLRGVYECIELPLVPVLARMERRGVLIDADQLRRQSQALAARMHQLMQRAETEAGQPFNLDSPKQLQAILFDKLGLPVHVKTPGGQPSTNEEALEAIRDAHPLPGLILDYRLLAKLRSTYTEKLPAMIKPASGRVHTSYHQAVAATGRLSSSDPNLQNIPVRSEEGRAIRAAFIAPPGWVIVSADYSQIELRIMAHLSGDAGLREAFRRGEDIHRATAAEVFGLAPEAVGADQRRAAKAINFGLIYGMSAFGLARQLGIGRGEAQAYMNRYFERYPGVRAYMERIREQAQRQGYVETLFGRRLYLPEIRARDAARRAGAERAAVNAPMQGTAADIIKRAMIAVDAWLQTREDDAHLIMQVHDELVLEVRLDALQAVRAGLIERMQGAAALDVPLQVEAGHGANWGEAH
ncbi:DNA polymerase I [Metallibacterium sp.]|uniref:DNA polymerase I n=1 Tax=Metallibacterium sp. TaxID=2940281 RepID=UPI002618C0C9|nr:DNA polymerase I [Metallibacterium sp.]